MQKKILYVTTEADPFLHVSSCASTIPQLAEHMANQGHDVRVIMPKFSVINERKHRIHEIQRLYGINISIEEENISLIVKVSFFHKSRIQVYFMDNEDLFQTKRIFHDESGFFYADNHTRLAFLCKATWGILENLGWAPDIIHCFGWPWAFVPLYGKRVYQRMPIFQNTRFIHTHNADYFRETFDKTMLKKFYMRHVKWQDLRPFGDVMNYKSFLQITKQYADNVNCSFSETNSPAVSILEDLDIHHIAHDENFVTNFCQIYDDVVSLKKDEQSSEHSYAKSD